MEVPMMNYMTVFSTEQINNAPGIAPAPYNLGTPAQKGLVLVNNSQYGVAVFSSGAQINLVQANSQLTMPTQPEMSLTLVTEHASVYIPTKPEVTLTYLDGDTAYQLTALAPETATQISGNVTASIDGPVSAEINGPVALQPGTEVNVTAGDINIANAPDVNVNSQPSNPGQGYTFKVATQSNVNASYGAQYKTYLPTSAITRITTLTFNLKCGANHQYTVYIGFRRRYDDGTTSPPIYPTAGGNTIAITALTGASGSSGDISVDVSNYWSIPVLANEIVYYVTGPDNTTGSLEFAIDGENMNVNSQPNISGLAYNKSLQVQVNNSIHYWFNFLPNSLATQITNVSLFLSGGIANHNYTIHYILRRNGNYFSNAWGEQTLFFTTDSNGSMGVETFLDLQSLFGSMPIIANAVEFWVTDGGSAHNAYLTMMVSGETKNVDYSLPTRYINGSLPSGNPTLDTGLAMKNMIKFIVSVDTKYTANGYMVLRFLAGTTEIYAEVIPLEATHAQHTFEVNLENRIDPSLYSSGQTLKFFTWGQDTTNVKYISVNAIYRTTFGQILG